MLAVEDWLKLVCDYPRQLFHRDGCARGGAEMTDAVALLLCENRNSIWSRDTKTEYQQEAGRNAAGCHTNLQMAVTTIKKNTSVLR